MKLIDDTIRRTGHGAETAPAQTGPVVADNAVGLRQLALEIAPAQHRGQESRFQHDRWAALSRFEQVKPVTAHINQPTRARKTLAIPAHS